MQSLQCYFKILSPFLNLLIFLLLAKEIPQIQSTFDDGVPVLRQANKPGGAITSEIMPWEIVEPNEKGFNYTSEEMSKLKIWPFGIIPYYIDDFSFDKTLISRLQHILNAVNSVTGLRFTELSQPPDSKDDRWVFFLNRRGVLECMDYSTKMFTYTGVQNVVVGYDCITEGGGALAPTILAIVGVPPQHNAPNRDDFIKVNESNVFPDKTDNFQKLENTEWLFHGMNYDFMSAGHYHFHMHSMNGYATISPKKFKIQAPVGEGDGFSYNDIWKIKKLYNTLLKQNVNMSDSTCSKLFKIRDGVKLNGIKTLKKRNHTPRQKPSLYLNGKESDDEKPNDNANKKPFKKLSGGKRGPTGGVWDHSDYDTA